jgi:hypothetical protein
VNASDAAPNDGHREGTQRPPFAGSFPRDPELDALVDAFVRGDYLRVRRGARELAVRNHDEAVARAARELLARTQADPLVVLLLLLAALLLMTLTWYWAVETRGRGGL